MATQMCSIIYSANTLLVCSQISPFIENIAMGYREDGDKYLYGVFSSADS